MANPATHPHPDPPEITPQQPNLLFKTDDVPRSADTAAAVGFCVGNAASKGAIVVAILDGATEGALDGAAEGALDGAAAGEVIEVPAAAASAVGATEGTIVAVAAEGPSLACCRISVVGVRVSVGMDVG